jgi:hypothetical protein
MERNPDPAGLAEDASFELLPPALAEDLVEALEAAVDAGVVFAAGPSPLRIFRAAVAESVRDIEAHPMGRLVGRFLREGPYEGPGAIPDDLIGKRLTDDEVAQAIRFIYSFMVNTFKGLVAELLAAQPVASIVEGLKRRKRLPASAMVFAGDVVQVRTLSGKRWAKGADFHVLAMGRERVRLYGVGEVKSYPMPRRGLAPQLDRHVERARGGLKVRGKPYDSGEVEVVEPSADEDVARIAIASERWKLPRDFRLDEEGLRLPEADVPVAEDSVREVAPGQWQVVLRWSQEALGEAALEMTFWYMGKVGEIEYVHRPPEWEEMTAAEAGQNAAKMMLYYALLRAPESSLFERQAVALYNSYGFGYALGMNFIGPGRRRRMLWPEDLREILRHGRTEDGGRVRGLNRR